MTEKRYRTELLKTLADIADPIPRDDWQPDTVAVRVSVKDGALNYEQIPYADMYIDPDEELNLEQQQWQEHECDDEIT